MSMPISSSPPSTSLSEPLWGGAQPSAKGTVEAAGQTYRWEQTDTGVWLHDENGSSAFVRDATIDKASGTIGGQSADSYLPATEPSGGTEPIW